MLLYILFIFVLAKGVQPYNACDRNRQNAANNMFNNLSNDIINLDKMVHDTCRQFTTFVARELFGGNSFRLEIMLPEFENAQFVVRVKHRVIYINGHYPRAGKQCDLTYVDIKILPEFVNTHGGAWTYSGGQLVVAFPYSYPIEDHDAGCGATYIDETLIQVRRGFPNEKIFLP